MCVYMHSSPGGANPGRPQARPSTKRRTTIINIINYYMYIQMILVIICIYRYIQIVLNIITTITIINIIGDVTIINLRSKL